MIVLNVAEAEAEAEEGVLVIEKKCVEFVTRCVVLRRITT
tara:strand:- start:141 stop:260 length:120 start_codon:yes stop_codon:yes gene_type:complete